MNGYPQYGYYGQPPMGQPMYPPGAQMQMPPASHGYPSFYPTHPSQMQQQPSMQGGMPHAMQPGQGPAPVPSFDAEAYANMQANAAASGSGSKKHKKRAASASASIPLKSAMKKNPQIMATPLVNSMEFPQQYNNGFSLSRQRTNSFGRSNHPDARKRAESNVYSPHEFVPDPPFQPLHMFISFDGLNGLKLENITELALKELRERIWRMWPDGVESQPASPSEVLVKFRNQPWDMSGPNHLVALKMLQELFTLCCRRGYVFQTAINTGHQQTPRLIFQVESPDTESTFFLGYLSSSGKRISVMNAPNPVELTLYMTLQRMLPRKLHSELRQVDPDTNLRHIEVKRGADVSPGLFLAHILKILSGLGYELDFSIPLQKRQSLGMSRVAQEVLVFKSFVG